MKKHIRLTIDEKLYKRLTTLCTHHGEQTHLIREGIKMIVRFKENQRKEALDYVDRQLNSGGTTTTIS